MRRALRLMTWLVLGALPGCQACTEVDQPLAYRCDRDAGTPQCLGGWRCGGDGFCFDPSREVARVCETNADCAETWRCGTPLAAEGRRDQVCRRAGAGAAYRCAADIDCEGAWRCGLAGVCLDTLAEALEPVATPAPPATSTVNPPLDPRGVTEVARSDRFRVPGICPRVPAERTVLSTTTADGQLQRLLVPGEFPADAGLSCDAGIVELSSASRLARAAVTTQRVSLDAGTVLALAQLRETTLALLAGGTVCSVGDDLTPRCESTGFNATGLRTSGTLAFVFDGSRYRIRDAVDGGWSPVLTVEDPSGDLPVLREVTALPSRGGLLPVLVATTPSAFYQVVVDERGRLNDGGWPRPNDWAPASAGPPNPCIQPNSDNLELLGVSFDRDTDHLLMRVKSTVSGIEGARVFASVSVPGSTCPALGGGTEYFSERTVEATCPEGTRMLWGVAGKLELRDSRETLEVRCEQPDGGLLVLHRDSSGAVAPGSPATLLAEPFQERGVLVSRTNTLATGSVGGSGGAWLVAGASRVPMVLDHAPQAFVTLADGGLPTFISATRPVSGSNTPAHALVLGGEFSWTPRGLPLTALEQLRVEAAAIERPELVVLAYDGRQLVATRGDRGPIAVPLALSTSLQTFSRPFRVTSQRSPDGGTVVLVSAGDALLAADVTPALNVPFDENQGSLEALPVLTVRAVPLSRSAITSLVALAPLADEAGRVRLAEGYLLSSGRLFRFEGDNEVVWRTTELQTVFGAPLEVFAQRGRARVGYASGEVYSLPSRVLLAPAIGRSELVQDYLVRCNGLLAVTATGLYRLETPSSGAVGSWTAVTVPFTPGPGATLHQHGGEVLVVTGRGAAHALGWECP